MHNPEVKPCPFCGERPYFRTHAMWTKGYGHDDDTCLVEVNVRCRGCGAELTRFDGGKKDETEKSFTHAVDAAFAAWNRRAGEEKGETR